MGTNHKLGSIAAVLVAEGKGILAADDGGDGDRARIKEHGFNPIMAEQTDNGGGEEGDEQPGQEP